MTPITLQHERERIRLGDEIKNLRRSKHITGIVLAEKTKISQSKLSKIETGALIPSTDDLRAILRYFKASRSDTSRLIEWARELRTEFVSWRFKHKKGLATSQIEVADLEKQAKHIRILNMATIPGLLQIPDYARRVLELANVTRQQDLENAVAARIQRQQILYETDRQFEFVITEGAALSRFCDPQVVTQQLDRIRFLFGLSNVKIGFLSNRCSLPRVPLNSFVIYDSQSVVVETLTGEIVTTDQADIALYNEAFEDLASRAVFGPDADRVLDEWKSLLIACATTSLAVPLHEPSTCS